MQLPLHGVLSEPASRPRFALAGKGFRPFFFGASVFAALIVPLWLLVLGGVVAPGRYLEPVAWHAHEMIFGYATAVIAGFLLTAVASWTQRETLTGGPLLALAGLWAVGRLAMLFAGALPGGLVAAIDLAFLPVLGVVLARPLIAAENRRNFVMLAILAVLTAANTAVHLEALRILGAGAARHAMRVGLDVIVLLMLVIAGRIVPMFTRNATKIMTITAIPWLDRLTALCAALLIAGDIALPDSRPTNGTAGLLAIVATARAAKWGTRHTLGHPLLWILHAGYLWIPIGLAMRAFSMPHAMHALTVGAIGGLTIGMMARVALGHTGRNLDPSKIIVAAFLVITAAAAARVYGAFFVAGGLWTLAFLLYLATFTPYLFTARPDGKAG
jgi:uncharacterized protein involved in response to NO